MSDPIYAEERLAELYDPLDPDRSDLDAHLALAEEFDARSVLDIGCSTVTLACLLACQGRKVTAVDPAAAPWRWRGGSRALTRSTGSMAMCWRSRHGR